MDLKQKFTSAIARIKKDFDSRYHFEGIGKFSNDGETDLAAVFRDKRDGFVLVLSETGLEGSMYGVDTSEKLVAEAKKKLAEEKAALKSGAKSESWFYPVDALQQIAQAKAGVLKKEDKIGPQITYGGHGWVL
jgi:hypothetical protein